MLAVLSDLHANAAAMRAAIVDARRAGADSFACLGDVVGYNSFPSETIELLRGLEAHSVCGNHDLMVIGELEPERCGPNARKAILWTRDTLDAGDREFLRRLPHSLVLGPGLLLLHSALGDPRVYLRTGEQFLSQFRLIRQAQPGVRVCLTGHTHTGRIVEIRDGATVRTLGRRRLRLRPDRFYFVNPGSVGHPRLEDYRASYVLFDVEAGRVSFRKVGYDRAAVDSANRTHDIHTDLGPSVLRFRWRAAKSSVRRLPQRLGLGGP